MDKAILVDEAQITDGEKLVEQLVYDNFDVSVAFWVKFLGCADNEWFFYVVSNTVDESGLQTAYRAVHSAIQKIPSAWGPYISLSTLRLVGLLDPIAKGVLAIRDRYPGRRWFRGANFDNLNIEEAYIYPAPPVRSSKIGENVKRFIDEGWELDGRWEDGYPCVRKGTNGVGFIYRIRVDEQMTPEKVPLLEGQRPMQGSGTIE
jgi:hypothetical protein